MANKRPKTPNVFKQKPLTDAQIEAVLRGKTSPEDKKIIPPKEKKQQKIESKQSKKTTDEYVRINITLKKNELEILDQTIDDLVEAGEIQKKNRSFIIRLALKKFIGNLNSD